MKKRLFLLLFLLSLFSNAQNFRIPYRIKNLWGYADQKGKIIVSPKYDSVAVENDNFRWFVFKNNKMGVIDSLGNEKLAVEYDSIERKPLHSQDNDFYLTKNNKKGYADINGVIIFPCDYDQIEACNEMYIGKILHFFVKNEVENAWTLQDYYKKTLLTDIQQFKSLHDGNYKIQVKNKWGFYNVSLQKWILLPEYDDIDYLDHDFDKKKEYAQFKYFAKKDNIYQLITEDFKIEKYQKPYLDFFEAEKTSGSNSVYSTYENGDIKIVTISKPKQSSVYHFDRNERTDPTKLQITEKKGKYGLQVTYNYETKDLPPKYDEIKILSNGSYNNREIVLLKKKDKYGIFSMKTFSMLTDIVFSNISLHKSQSIIILHDKNKIGLYQFDDGRNDFPTTVIMPDYDKFVRRDYARSLDEKYRSFEVYYFKKNNKTCIVGMNGMQFFAD